MTPQDEKTWSMLAHLSGLLLGLFGPLVVMILYKDKSAVVEAHAKEALNFQITMAIAMTISAFLCIILIGFLCLFVLGIAIIVLPIIAGLKANDNEEYRYPYIWRLV